MLPGKPLREGFDLYHYWLQRSSSSSPLNRMLYADTRFYLPNDMLVKVDRMTMAHGLEARAPFLDHCLVELAARLPDSWKLKGLVWKKYLLRRLLKGKVPACHPLAVQAGLQCPRGVMAQRGS